MVMVRLLCASCLLRHETTGELKQHLILNHIILLYNVFGDAATPLMDAYLYYYTGGYDKFQSRNFGDTKGSWQLELKARKVVSLTRLSVSLLLVQVSGNLYSCAIALVPRSLRAGTYSTLHVKWQRRKLLNELMQIF